LSDFRHAIALTGGIGSGKSTVGSILKLYGYTVIEADGISSELIKRPDVVDEIKDKFGEEYISGDEVDKAKLGNLIFSDLIAKKKLESILHPKIREMIKSRTREIEDKGVDYFIDIPLFYETKSYEIDRVLLIYAPKEIQIERIVKRNHISEREALKRVESQISNEEKKNLATYVLDNSKDLKHLQGEIRNFLQNLRQRC